MDINKNDTAVLVTDPQNDFLSEQGVTWQLVGDSVAEMGNSVLTAAQERRRGEKQCQHQLHVKKFSG